MQNGAIPLGESQGHHWTRIDARDSMNNTVLITFRYVIQYSETADIPLESINITGRDIVLN